MPDLLCSLVTLPDIGIFLEPLRRHAIFVRRPNPWEKDKVQQFVEKNWTRGWAQEVDVAFSRQPISCFVATKEEDIIGFSAYESTRRGFFGPMGVLPEHRKKEPLFRSQHGLQSFQGRSNGPVALRSTARPEWSRGDLNTAASPRAFKGIGTALLLAGLMGLQDLGYVYGIIGAAGPVDFYHRACGAVPITLNGGRGIYGLKEEPRFMGRSRTNTQTK